MISCIIAVKDRNDRLETMLRSWLTMKEIGDFVIVDWSSQVPIINSPVIQKELENKRIKILRVEGQRYFYRCLAWNLAYQYTNPINRILLKLDVDYININSNWVKSLRIKDRQLFDYFITGSSEFYESSLGFLLINKRDFNKGYNENALPIWGHEDNDLIERLENNKNYTSIDKQIYKSWSNLERIIFFNIKEYIYHLPHSFYEDEPNLLSFRDKGLNKWNLSLKNREIFNSNLDWEPAQYEIIENKGYYIRLKCLNNDKLEQQIKNNF
jgi:hypothetical protein